MVNSNWADKAFNKARGVETLPQAEAYDLDGNPRPLGASLRVSDVEVHLVDLNDPDTWTHQVWTAFERARSDRIEANIRHNEGRRVGQAGCHIVTDVAVVGTDEWGNPLR